MWNIQERRGGGTDGRLSAAATKMLILGLEAVEVSACMAADMDERLETGYACLDRMGLGEQVLAIQAVVCEAINPDVPVDFEAPAWKEAAIAYLVEEMCEMAATDVEHSLEGSAVTTDPAWDCDARLLALCKEEWPGILREVPEYEYEDSEARREGRARRARFRKEPRLLLVEGGYYPISERIKDIFLWDRDFEMEDVIQAAMPEVATGALEKLGIVGGYYSDGGPRGSRSDEERARDWIRACCVSFRDVDAIKPLMTGDARRAKARVRATSWARAVIEAASRNEPFMASCGMVLCLQQMKLLGLAIPLKSVPVDGEILWRQLQPGEWFNARQERERIDAHGATVNRTATHQA